VGKAEEAKFISYIKEFRVYPEVKGKAMKAMKQKRDTSGFAFFRNVVVATAWKKNGGTETS
jgi:hypothetical protein